jgi:hypothetical protein
MKRSPTKHNFSLGVLPMPRVHETSRHVFAGSQDVGKLLRGLLIDAEYEAVMEYIVSLEKALQARDEADAGASL